METVAPRTYNDPCGIARALDLIGERWALLVVRELLLGPKRFSQLRRGLPEASSNVLSQRLRELEAAGVVRRYRLGPPADVPVYELTERGYALEPLLLELGRWGSQAPITSQSELGVDALMVALKTRFDPSRAAGMKATYELRIGDDRFALSIGRDGFRVARSATPVPGAATSLTADPATFRSVLFGRLSTDAAIESGKLDVEGDRGLIDQLVALFSD